MKNANKTIDDVITSIHRQKTDMEFMSQLTSCYDVIGGHRLSVYNIHRTLFDLTKSGVKIKPAVVVMYIDLVKYHYKQAVKLTKQRIETNTDEQNEAMVQKYEKLFWKDTDPINKFYEIVSGKKVKFSS